MKKPPLRVGVAGLGVISAVHLEAIQNLETAQLVAVCDQDPAKKANAGPVPFYTDLKEMLQHGALDVLHICLPHHLHVPAILLAGEFGVHAFVEKPVGLHLADIKKLEGIAIKVGVCLQNRYNPTTLKLREVLDQQIYGPLKGSKAVVTWNRGQEYYGKDPWRGTLSEAGGGAMLSQAIHTLDLMYLVGGPVKWVKSLAGNLLREEIEVEDTACAQMVFENGTQGIFYGTVTHCFNSAIEVEIVCEKGVLKVQDGRLVGYGAGGLEVLAQDEAPIGRKSYYGISHQEAIRKFYGAVIDDTNDYITIEEATWSVAICQEVMASSKSGKRQYFRDLLNIG